MTNPLERDTKPRLPVFIISKQFIPGRELKPAVYTDKGLKSLSFSGICGTNQFTKANYLEMAYMNSTNNIDKEIVKSSCERIFRTVAEHYLQSNYSSLEIPEVGTLIINGGFAAVHFQEALKWDVRTILSRSIKERKERLESNLTVKNVQKLANEEENNENHDLFIEENAKTWLSTNLNLNIDEVFGKEKPRNININNNNNGKNEENEEVLQNINEITTDLQPKDLLFESVSQRNYAFLFNFLKN